MKKYKVLYTIFVCLTFLFFLSFIGGTVGYFIMNDSFATCIYVDESSTIINDNTIEISLVNSSAVDFDNYTTNVQFYNKEGGLLGYSQEEKISIKGENTLKIVYTYNIDISEFDTYQVMFLSKDNNITWFSIYNNISPYGIIKIVLLVSACALFLTIAGDITFYLLKLKAKRNKK